MDPDIAKYFSEGKIVPKYESRLAGLHEAEKAVCVRTQTQSPLGISNTPLYDKESWPACHKCGPGTPHTSKGLSLKPHTFKGLGPGSQGGMRIKKDIGCTDVLSIIVSPKSAVGTQMELY